MTGKMSKRARLVVVKREKREALRIADQVKELVLKHQKLHQR